VKHQPVAQIGPRLAVFEQSQGGNAQDRHDVLQQDVHWDPEHFAMQKPAEHVHDYGEYQDRKQVVEF
jgi:hypothetical protein